MKVESIDKNKVKITFEVGPERFEEGLKHAYNKNKGKLNIPGFRKGKAPRKVIEVQYGKEVFFEDAINFVLPEAYESAIKEGNVDTVSKPEIDVEEVSVEKGVVFFAEVFTKPEVTIDDYKGVTYKKANIEVTEDEINAEIDTAREKNSRMITITDRPIKSADIVTIDFKGSVDGEVFEGGIGEDYDLTIGSHTFIDTFEDQLIGSSVGDDLEVHVTFPENYHSKDLSGKSALFKVEIKDIKEKELPEINDEFAQDVSEFDTLEEYKQSIRNTIEQKKGNEAANQKENDIMLSVIERASMDIPQVMIDYQVDKMVNDFANRIKSQGLSLDMYLQYVGQTKESLREAYLPNAESQVKGRLVLEAIAAKENFDISDNDIDEELETMAKSYNMEKVMLEKAMRDEDKVALKVDIAVRRALELVEEHAVEVED